MKRRELLAGMAALGVAGPVQARPLMPLHEKPREMLSPPFVDGKGRDLTLADFRGRVVLLNIWATWCVPCREEMPTLDALQEKMGGGDFHVLPLSIDRAGMKIVRRFYDEIGLRHLDTYLAEDIRVMAAFAVVGLPTTILIDRDGFERGRLVGPAEWDSPEVMAQIQNLINERSE
ncbi:TlpA family protein disulfide reductase [Sulfitobacter sp. KE29]|jgi:thiol-disulfide isomerase/thioredoxin|uniref:Thiol-disulfide isomerase-like thioredoxin n=2 Tax=Roseobacteraceae TaxID=2854170 RepID=A0A1P8UNM1_9RHOB|nr:MULTISPECIES: TlpA disulfide reductase family protein [Rhodobacterales]OZB14608.1 MAG: thiol:disulfide interchange protein [Rhodobacterales bacterium 34-62-10]APZ50957.1 thiol-disulfide isomerase-like thioredoxin [Salipiger abyssi]MDF3419554.1 TlpA family protein disulfide reductase [Sulfitobacter sp. Ks38]MDF3427036.1 TlpA family protein disulfide reductase [Sulfitobacter sp. KE29]MDF3430618.1 TlpA family protein disulfide reductase [Sulfitobacter sp. S46]